MKKEGPITQPIEEVSDIKQLVLLQNRLRTALICLDKFDDIVLELAHLFPLDEDFKQLKEYSLTKSVKTKLNLQRVRKDIEELKQRSVVVPLFKTQVTGSSGKEGIATC